MIDFKKEIAEIIAKNLEGLTEDEIKSMIYRLFLDDISDRKIYFE